MSIFFGVLRHIVYFLYFSQSGRCRYIAEPVGKRSPHRWQARGFGLFGSARFDGGFGGVDVLMGVIV